MRDRWHDIPSLWWVELLSSSSLLVSVAISWEGLRVHEFETKAYRGRGGLLAELALAQERSRQEDDLPL